jgi:hypothetical protein
MLTYWDLLQSARRVNGNTFFWNSDYSELFCRGKEMIAKLKKHS